MNLGLLSKLEKKVVIGLCKGLTDREIAKRLALSPNTVKALLFRMFDKLIMMGLKPDS